MKATNVLCLSRFFFVTLLYVFLSNSSASEASIKKPIQEEVPSLDINLRVEKYKLKNGMTVLLHSDQRIPQINHQLWVKVGSRDEEEGKTGLAHLFEHMMFRGTDKYSGQEYDKKQESLGALNNAFTSRDHTVYYVTFPSAHLETILEMESERLNSLQLTQNNFDKEREVVKEERRQRTDNNPNDFFEPIMKMVFPTHPYGRPIIGSMQDLDNSVLNDCQEFYSKYYSPNNIVLVLAGDFKINSAKKLIQKYYGHLEPSKNLKDRFIPAKEKEHQQTKHEVYKRNIQAPTIAFAYRVPKIGTNSSYVLEILSHILSQGESSRLYDLLIHRKNMALAVGSYYYGLKDEGVFIIYAMLAPDADLAKVKQLIHDEIQKISDTEVHSNELLKSTRSIMYEYVSSMKMIHRKARVLGVNESLFGDYTEFFKDLERYQKVTTKQIKQAAGQFFSKNNTSIVELLPL